MAKRASKEVAALERQVAKLEKERREIFERLRELEGERTERALELVTMAAHELHTPLQSLLIGTDSIAQRLTGTADELPREWLLERIVRQQRTLSHLAGLIRSLLGVAELRAGTMELSRAPVDLAALARDVVTRLADELTWARCAVTVDERHAAVGDWDAARLDGVISNLLSNAIKFGAGNPIDVVVDSDDVAGSLVVRDHGIGIQPDDKKRIFDRFERGNAAPTTPGFGLGLWVARALLRELGGAITVESEPGAGAAFTVRLPRAA